MSELRKKLDNFIRRESPREEPESEIRAHLQRLYDRSTHPKHFPDEAVIRRYQRLDECVSGRWQNTPFGDIFIGLTRYPETHEVGTVPVKRIFSIDDNWLSRLGNFGRETMIDFRQTVFVDTETTGLSGGSGTVAFLIGIGYFVADEFQVDQYFIDTFTREEGMLDLVAKFIKPYPTVVTFNGKTFDLPLLESRYVMVRQTSPFAGLDHLDLLHPSRQLWKLELENCRLQTIEQKILHFNRIDDVPGEEAPLIYFRYLRDGNPVPLQPVFKHNADDIISMAAVTYQLWRQFHAKDEDVSSGLIDHARGRILTNKGEPEMAAQAYQKALQGELSLGRRKDVLIRLALLQKRLGRWDEFEATLRQAIEMSDPFHMLPFEELAKYYEHRKKDYAVAIETVSEAIRQLPTHRVMESDDLMHRLNRLHKKMGG